jgi:hypothetical protein
LPILRDFRLHPEHTPEEEVLEKIMIENQCSYEEACQIEYKKNAWDIIALFNKQTRYIVSLYCRFFQKYKTEDCKMIIINLMKQITDTRIINCDGMYEIQIQYDYNDFFKLSENNKKKKILDLLKEGIDKIIKEKQWDRNAFDEAYKKVIEVDYVNEWYYKKALRSPTKEYKAAVFCEHKKDVFDITIIIMNKKGEEIKRKKVLSLPPREVVFDYYLGKLKWISDDTVVLTDCFENEQWEVKI